MTTTVKYIDSFFKTVNNLRDLVRVDDMEIQGTAPGGQTVNIKVGSFKFDSGVHDAPLKFTVIARVDGIPASRVDYCTIEEQKAFQAAWVPLNARLQLAEFKAEDKARAVAGAVWNNL